MKRAIASLSTWQRVKLAWNLLSNKDPITKEEVEKCKDRDLLEVREQLVMAEVEVDINYHCRA